MVFFSPANAQYITPDHLNFWNNRWIKPSDPEAEAIREQYRQKTRDPRADYFTVNYHGKPTWVVVDAVTKDRHLFEHEWVVRFKCLELLIASAPVHLTVGWARNFAIMVYKGLTSNYDGSDDVEHAIVRVVVTPLAVVGLLFAAFWGLVISPYDGRKLYATIERYLYHGGGLANCFQSSNPLIREGSHVEVCRCLYLCEDPFIA